MRENIDSFELQSVSAKKHRKSIASIWAEIETADIKKNAEKETYSYAE